MAHLEEILSPKSIAKVNSLPSVKAYYNKLAIEHMKMLEHKWLLCPKCGEWKPIEDNFYLDKEYEVERFPICKKCLLMMAEQKNDRHDEPNETKESIQKVLRFMNRVYDDEYYKACLKSIKDSVGEVQKASVFQLYITGIQSLPQFKRNGKLKTWEDSNFGNNLVAEDEEERIENDRLVEAGQKRFGKDYSPNDLYFLETQYEDWVSRYECQTKAQEELFERLSFKKWEIMKATKNGESTEKLDKTYQELLNTANITPKQTGMDAFADAQTLGTLIQKWEDTRPLPEIDPELQDVDRIGLYIDAFFRGHTSKMLGIKNKFTNIYEKVMSKYTVKPPEYEDDEASEIAFDKIFGASEDF